MKKILRLGNDPNDTNYQATCYHCNTHFTYQREDMEKVQEPAMYGGNGRWTVSCPNERCGNKVEVPYIKEPYPYAINPNTTLQAATKTLPTQDSNY